MWLPLDAIRRAWRTRGFGIHSPMAYEMVRRVVGCKHAYYAFDAMAAAAGSRRELRLACVLYRTALHLRPAAIDTYGTPPPACAEALRALTGAYTPGSGVLHTVWADAATLPRPAAGHTLLLGATGEPRQAALLREMAPQSVVLAGRRAAIALIRPDINPQRHEVLI